jgi:hypothetical protein
MITTTDIIMVLVLVMIMIEQKNILESCHLEDRRRWSDINMDISCEKCEIDLIGPA